MIAPRCMPQPVTPTRIVGRVRPAIDAVSTSSLSFKLFATTVLKSTVRRVKQGGKPGYPRFKKKGCAIHLERATAPPMRFEGCTLAPTVRKQADGWYVVILIDTSDSLSEPLYQQKLSSRLAELIVCNTFKRSRTLNGTKASSPRSVAAMRNSRVFRLLCRIEDNKDCAARRLIGPPPVKPSWIPLTDDRTSNSSVLFPPVHRHR